MGATQPLATEYSTLDSSQPPPHLAPTKNLGKPRRRKGEQLLMDELSTYYVPSSLKRRKN